MASASAASAVAGVTPPAASVAVAMRDASWPRVKRCRPKVAPRATATPRQKSSAASRVAPTTTTSVAAGQPATKAAAASSRDRADADTTVRDATVPLHYRRKMPVQVDAAARNGRRLRGTQSRPRAGAAARRARRIADGTPWGRPATRESVAADRGWVSWSPSRDQQPASRRHRRILQCPKPPSTRPRSSSGRPPDWWVSLNDEQLLDVRMCDLGVTIEGSKLEARIAELHAELERAQPRVQAPLLVVGRVVHA